MSPVVAISFAANASAAGAATQGRRSMRAVRTQAVRAQRGFTLVELALLLAVILPLMLAALAQAQQSLRSWQIHETTSAAVRYVADVEPAALVDARRIDEELKGRCGKLAEQLKALPTGLRIERCGRAGSHHAEVALVLPGEALLPELSASLQWRLHALP